MYLSKLELLFFPDICPGMGLLDHMVTIFLDFSGTSILVSIVSVPIYILTDSVGGFPFLHTLSSIFICRLLDEDHSDQCEVIPHCSFDLYFSNN